MAQPFKRYFTPAEAEKTLPLVRQIVRDILDLSHEVRILATMLGAEAEDHPQIEDKVQQLRHYLRELEEIGCFYKDWNFSIGLVDFPAVIDGREVFLCWRSDEPSIQYYHDIDAGYAGRQPIPEHYLERS
ncbi:MAG: DUF2203 family protein [Calditrichaeota bacterium]|nr:MAG: DUF2203 family protein [Calditrichota bacterium]